MYIEIGLVLVLISSICSSRLPLEVFQHHHTEHHLHHRRLNHNIVSIHKKKLTDVSNFKILYQLGNSESELPVCNARAVCSKIDLYEAPWIERQCKCPGNRLCPSGLNPDDGYTITDKTRQYKLCESIQKLAKCRYFRDVTWTLLSTPDNFTEQIVHCHCPKNSVIYLIKRQAYHTASGHVGFQYSFACSPQSRLRCQRKEPCRLFTVRKRQELDEVNTNTLCQCPHAHRCPHHHTDYGVIAGKSYIEEAIRTYSGFCLPP